MRWRGGVWGFFWWISGGMKGRDGDLDDYCRISLLGGGGAGRFECVVWNEG